MSTLDLKAGDRVVYRGRTMPRYQGVEYTVIATDDKGRVYLRPIDPKQPLISTPHPAASLRLAAEEGAA